MTAPRIVFHVPVIEDALDGFREALGRDAPGYRGHVYRTFHFATALAQSDADPRDLAIAAALHDIGIWADATFDYLRPSAQRARQHALERYPELDADAVERIVLWHHKLTSCRALAGPRGEAFRRADLVDLSFGVLRFGLDRSFVAELRSVFPNAGFHRCLLRQAARWTARHPTRPLPMLSW